MPLPVPSAANPFTPIALLLLALLAPACNHRAVVPVDEADLGAPMMDLERPPDASPDQAPPLPDMMLPPDGPLPDQVGPSAPCTDKSAHNPNGRKPVSYRKGGGGKWHIAMDVDASYQEISVGGGQGVAAAVDNSAAYQEVAGFVTHRATGITSIKEELTVLREAISLRFKVYGGKVTVRTSGTYAPGHDLYPVVKSTFLDLKLTGPSTVSEVRETVVAALMGTSPAALGNLPASFGDKSDQFVLRFVTLRRYQLKLHPVTGKPLVDAQGYGVDSGDKSRWATLVMGAVARKSTYQDAKRRTGFLVDDLSNGTALATPAAKASSGCDLELIQDIPRADIIWVSDESTSMDDNRKDIVNNATNFFNRALASGLDFRMGVTGVCNPNAAYGSSVGRFCSTSSKDWGHSGGVDRFLLANEKAAFSGCINNPPGKVKGAEFGMLNAVAAVKRHLPRASGAPGKIRKGAKLVIIVATDEYPNSMLNILNFGIFNPCLLKTYTRTELDKELKQYLDYFSGAKDPEAKATVHVIGGTCGNSCGALVAHGYRDVAQHTGGMVGDICQKNLGHTLQEIIDHTVGTVSPVKLKHVPISGTLAVSLDGVSVLRSRTKGFEYREATNTLAFIDIKYKKGMKVVVGYKRWE